MNSTCVKLKYGYCDNYVVVFYSPYQEDLTYTYYIRSSNLYQAYDDDEVMERIMTTNGYEAALNIVSRMNSCTYDKEEFNVDTVNEIAKEYANDKGNNTATL